MKQLFLTVLLLALPLFASAYDCKVDGIYFNLIPKGNVAEVTYQGYNDIYNNYYSDYSGSVTIPMKFTYNGVEYTVTSIGEGAFEYCSELTSVKIPNSVTSIGKRAFRYCEGLISVTIPNSVTSIGNSAFSGCSSLTSLNITDLEAWCKIEFDGSYSNPLSWAHHLYLNGKEIKYLVIPNSVTTIRNNTFIGCRGLISVTIPNSVTNIGEHSFSNYSGLTSVTIPNSVATIGEDAFYGCSGLTSVTVPNSVTTIGNGAFQKCSSLTSVTIPNSVTSIGEGAFLGCIGLTSVIIPNSIINIGKNLFNGCSGLTSVVIPNSVTSIGAYAFGGCSRLASVSLPNSISNIGNSAYAGCSSLTSVTIPNSVTSIGSGAFAECSKLEEVYCLAEKVPSTSSDAFEKSYPEYMTLYVPAASLNNYKTTEPWSYFGTIKAISGTGEEPQKCATPTISYANKELSFSCTTEGVEYVYEIKDADIKKGYDAKVSLSATYDISVYATKAGYENSDLATATLVWTEAIFTETTEPSTSAKAVTESIPVLISAQGGTITVKCEQEGQPVAVYTADGKALGSANVKDGQATVATNIQRGEIVIVKVGGRSVKVKM